MHKNLSSFFHPKSIGVVGVSANPKKLGTQILGNILSAGFEGEVFGINPKFTKNDPPLPLPSGAKYVSSIGEDLDLLVVVTPAFTVEEIVREASEKKTKNIMVISAGFGEGGNPNLCHQLLVFCKKFCPKTLSF